MFSGLCCYKHCYHRLYIHTYLCPCTNVSTGRSPTSRLEGSKGLQTFTCLLENFSSYDSCSIPVILLQFLQQCTLLSFLVFNVIGETLYHIIVLHYIFKNMTDYRSFMFVFFLWKALALPLHWIVIVVVFLIGLQDLSPYISSLLDGLITILVIWVCFHSFSLPGKNCFTLMWLAYRYFSGFWILS